MTKTIYRQLFQMKLLLFIIDLSENLRQLGVDYRKIWKAHRCTKNKEDVLVVEMQDCKSDPMPEQIKTHENVPVVYVKADSTESRAMARKDLNFNDGSKQSEFDEAQNAIDECLDSLMKAHTNIVAVELSCQKSRNFGTEDEMIDSKTTVVILCRIKGFCPDGEDLFPEKIGNFPTDVRQDFISTACAKAKEYHPSLRIGCAVSAKDVSLSGTLGALFSHPSDKKKSAISCAHVFFPPSTLENKKADLSQLIDTPIDTVQPPHPDPRVFGKVTEAKIVTGNETMSGVDGAIIQLETRIPKDNCFPDTPTTNIESIGINLLYYILTEKRNCFEKKVITHKICI